MALIESDRVAVWETYMRSNTDPISVLKLELRSAIDAVDNWIDANQASFNSALPEPARSSLTASQKAALLMYVAQKRYL